MKKTTRSLFLILSVIAARAADIGTTHYFLRGDLRREANPLAGELGFDWSQLFLSNIILTLMILIGVLFYCFGRTKKICENIDTLSEFGGICLYNTS